MHSFFRRYPPPHPATPTPSLRIPLTSAISVSRYTFLSPVYFCRFGVIYCFFITYIAPIVAGLKRKSEHFCFDAFVFLDTHCWMNSILAVFVAAGCLTKGVEGRTRARKRRRRLGPGGGGAESIEDREGEGCPFYSLPLPWRVNWNSASGRWATTGGSRGWGGGWEKWRECGAGGTVAGRVKGSEDSW